MTQATGIAEPTSPHIAGRIGPQGWRTKDSAPVEQVAARSRELDQVDLSDTARRAGGVASGVGGTVGETGVRMDVVERARQNIAAGKYDTDEVLDATVDRLLRVLDGGQA